MLTEQERTELREVIHQKISEIESDIERFTNLSKPVSPENAIGRISRMDAINNKSINEAALRKSKNRLVRLKNALKSLPTKEFGNCRQCGEAIEFNKLKVFPESVRCVKCVKSDR